MWIELTYSDSGWLPGVKVTVNTDAVTHIAVHPSAGTMLIVDSYSGNGLPVAVQETYAEVLSLLGTIGRVV